MPTLMDSATRRARSTSRPPTPTNSRPSPVVASRHASTPELQVMPQMTSSSPRVHRKPPTGDDHTDLGTGGEPASEQRHRNGPAIGGRVGLPHPMIHDHPST